MYRTGLLPLLLLASLALPACAQDNTAQANHLPAENTASPMTRFPAGLFRSGFYVDVDTPCESASNANTLLLGRARYSGEINWIEQKSPTVFEVNVTGFIQGHEDTFQETIRFQSATELCALSQDGSCSRKKRYCPQQQMPNFRNNDIRFIDGH